MENRNRHVSAPISVMVAVALAVLMLGVIGGVLLDRLVAASAAAPADEVQVPAGTTSEFEMLTKAWSTIDNEYVDKSALKPQDMGYGAISGMVDALGDTGHSRFLSPEMVKQLQSQEQGQFEGVGIEVQVKNGDVVVVAPIDGTPAQKAGVRPGWIIAAVNGQNMLGVPLEQVVTKVLGPAGTKVTITFQDPATGTTKDLTLTRARIQIENVRWTMIPGTKIADLRLAAFSDGVTQQVQSALQQIEAQGATGVIFDLREDPGGLVSEAIGVGSQFVPSGNNLFLEKDSKGKTNPIPAKPGGAGTKIPLVVLVDEGTASAAEIVTGAIHDAHRGTVVGQTTFGTGTVLSEFPLPDGSALLLAVQEWLTPSGSAFWHKGIAPDVQVALPANTAPLVPEAMQGMTAQAVQSSGDAQLLRGLSILSGSGK